MNGDWKASKIMTDNIDAGKPHPTALYLYEIELEGERYGGELVALNAKQAIEFAEKMGGHIRGRVTDERLEKICSICGKDFPLVSKEDVPSLPRDEWPEEL